MLIKISCLNCNFQISFIDILGTIPDRYYENHEDQGGFWLDSYNTSLMDLDAPKLSKVGLAYDKPWHLEKYRPKQLF